MLIHRKSAPRIIAVALVGSMFVVGRPAAATVSVAQAVVSPAPSPDPSPTATPRALGIHVRSELDLSFIGQHTSGPGQLPPESGLFRAGGPLIANTPYDLFSGAPEVSGNAGIGEIRSTVGLTARAFDIGLDTDLAGVDGSVTNAAYWGENLPPALNPHLGSRALPYVIAFPAHAGQDDGSAPRASIVAGRAATADGNLVLRAGWFDLLQSDPFVFTPPNLTSVNPAIAYAPAESLASGSPGLDDWQPLARSLPLHGLDLFAKRGFATVEFTNAALPAPPGQSVQLTMGSAAFQPRDGTRLSGQIVHVAAGGDPFSAPASFGTQPSFTPYAQGVSESSTVNGQTQTIAGIRGASAIASNLGLDGVVEIARSWYTSRLAALPGTSAPGGFYHAGVVETRGRLALSLDGYRMEPGYATMVLPYGANENVWGALFAWPSPWPVGYYQLVDNSVAADNRQGFRVRASLDKGPIEIHAERTDLRQIEPATIAAVERTGFVDPYFLPQHDSAGTLGRQQHAGLWVAWHPALGDLTLDLTDDTVYRPFIATSPADGVSFEAPQTVVTFARHVSPTVVASAGLGRYALKGSYDEPLDFAQRIYFAGAEIAQTPRSAMLVSVRRSIFAGRSTYPASSLAPDFAGTLIVIEQRLRL